MFLRAGNNKISKILQVKIRNIANAVRLHYPKYVVTMDDLAAGNINGVKIFLLYE